MAYPSESLLCLASLQQPFSRSTGILAVDAWSPKVSVTAADHHLGGLSRFGRPCDGLSYCTRADFDCSNWTDASAQATGATHSAAAATTFLSELARPRELLPPGLAPSTLPKNKPHFVSDCCGPFRFPLFRRQSKAPLC